MLAVLEHGQKGKRLNALFRPDGQLQLYGRRASAPLYDLTRGSHESTRLQLDNLPHTKRVRLLGDATWTCGGQSLDRLGPTGKRLTTRVQVHLEIKDLWGLRRQSPPDRSTAAQGPGGLRAQPRLPRAPLAHRTGPS
ncbi:MAG: hypothetical protein JKY65_14450 [Planctomycetes bacterium]|nr:hypothetical protein [Planctomycetota bacterium]